MNLEITLTELFDNGVRNFKIGCKDGSGFVFCGGLELGKIRALSAKAYSSAVREEIRRREYVLNGDQNRMRIIIEALKRNATAFIEEYGRTVPSPDQLVKWWMDAEKDAAKQLKYNQQRAKNLKNRIQSWKDYPYREVIEFYPSMTEPNTMIIIIDGEEQANAWTTQEFKGGKMPEEEA